MKMRLQKYLADCGVASRRAAEKLIADGKCEVNGKIVTEMGIIVETGSDKIKVSGRSVAKRRKMIYIMLNKPSGYITTVSEQFGRPAVTDLIKINERLFPVGRLDCDATGLLLLTNDGDFAYRLTHPKFNVPKTYVARVTGRMSGETVGRFKKGIDIGGYVTRPATLEILGRGDGHTTVKITISEGKNKQVKKMCEVAGHEVVSLRRIAIGGLKLGNLKEGEYRALTPDEIKKVNTGIK